MIVEAPMEAVALMAEVKVEEEIMEANPEVENQVVIFMINPVLWLSLTGIPNL